MTSFLKLTLAASVAMVLVTGCSQSDGDSTSGTTPPAAPAPLTGSAIDGYLAGATVWADCTPDHTLDTLLEQYTTADANGDYNLTTTCPNATLIASGGIDLSTGLPFTGILTAPAGSDNITPLTTLVVAGYPAEEIEAAFGIAADADFLELNNTAATILAVSVAQTINVVAVTTNVDTSVLIDTIITDIANDLTVSALTDTTVLAESLQTSAVTSVNTIIETVDTVDDGTPGNVDLNDTLTATIATLVNDIDIAITDGDDAALATATTDAVTTVEEVIASLSFSAINVAIPTGNTDLDLNQFVTPLSVEEGQFTTLTVDFDIIDYNSVYNGVYPVSITASIDDTTSGRSAVITITNIDINLSSSSKATIDSSQATATITGTDTDGVTFGAIAMDASGTVLDNGVTAITVDIAALETLLASNTTTDHPLDIFGQAGTYFVKFLLSGVPASAETTGFITITPAP